MELIATTRPASVAYAYGASLSEDGSLLTCGLLFVEKGNTRRRITLRCPVTKQRIRVQLPPEAIRPARHLRFSNEDLEVIRAPS
ncbi:hypothetical protein [uncultured Deinococcus sp.]|uniref:hypothetical protein n=1 Tax=uncultured Deinococcus sp. TaxID=158789 RepID=UPI0025DE2544|nr:hypothetical protein [uncultured Deinococcus sp.]